MPTPISIDLTEEPRDVIVISDSEDDGAATHRAAENSSEDEQIVLTSWKPGPSKLLSRLSAASADASVSPGARGSADGSTARRSVLFEPLASTPGGQRLASSSSRASAGDQDANHLMTSASGSMSTTKEGVAGAGSAKLSGSTSAPSSAVGPPAVASAAGSAPTNQLKHTRICTLKLMVEAQSSAGVVRAQCGKQLKVYVSGAALAVDVPADANKHTPTRLGNVVGMEYRSMIDLVNSRSHITLDAYIVDVSGMPETFCIAIDVSTIAVDAPHRRERIGALVARLQSRGKLVFLNRDGDGPSAAEFGQETKRAVAGRDDLRPHTISNRRQGDVGRSDHASTLPAASAPTPCGALEFATTSVENGDFLDDLGQLHRDLHVADRSKLADGRRGAARKSTRRATSLMSDEAATAPSPVQGLISPPYQRQLDEFFGSGMSRDAGPSRAQKQVVTKQEGRMSSRPSHLDGASYWSSRLADGYRWVTNTVSGAIDAHTNPVNRASSTATASLGPLPKRHVKIDDEFVEVDADPSEASRHNDQMLAAQTSSTRPGQFDELLTSMAQNQYRGPDAMSALYGEEAAFDVARLPSYADPDALHRRGLRTPLHTHQSQGLRWMVAAEHRTMPTTKEDQQLLWVPRWDARKNLYWWHLAKNEATRRRPVLPKGGILADGMGLGKTLQIIALCLSDKDGIGAEKPEHVNVDAKSVASTTGSTSTSDKIGRQFDLTFDSSSGTDSDPDDRSSRMKATKKLGASVHRKPEEPAARQKHQKGKDRWSDATLVVCPLSIANQWLEQINAHTRGVKAMIYHGQAVVRQTESFADYDIIITTWDTLKNQHRPILQARAAAELETEYAAVIMPLEDELRDALARRESGGDMTTDQRAELDADIELLEQSIQRQRLQLVEATAAASKQVKRRQRTHEQQPNKRRKGKGKALTRPRGYETDSDFGASEAEEVLADDLVDRRTSTADAHEASGLLYKTLWRRVVLDEAHIARNPRTAIFHSITDLQTERKWSVTGTPIVNGTRDLGTLCAWHGLEPFCAEARAWTTHIERSIRHNTGNGTRLLNNIVRTLVLRRVKAMKGDDGRALVELPKIDVFQHTIPLREADRAYYELCERAMQERVQIWIQKGVLRAERSQVLVFLMWLRQLSCHRSLVSPDLLEQLKRHDWSKDAAPTGSSARLSDADKKRLEATLEAAVSAGDECPICLQALFNLEPVITPCSHVFCKECISAVIAGHNAKCPLDRKPLPKAGDLVELPTSQSPRQELGASAVPSDSQDEQWQAEGGSAKLDEILRILQGLEDQDPTEKVLIFSNFTKHLDIISKRLKEEDIPHCCFDGRMDKQRRELSLASFRRPLSATNVRHRRPQGLLSTAASPHAAADQKGSYRVRRLLAELELRRARGSAASRGSRTASRADQAAKDEEDGVGVTVPRVMLLSIGAGSLGLNLTAASVCIIADPWWQSAIEQQAVDRIHRIGQTRPCKVFHVSLPYLGSKSVRIDSDCSWFQRPTSKFIAQRTIENRMQEIQRQKEALTATAFQSFTANGRRVAEARSRRETGLGDLAQLLGLSADYVRMAREQQ